MKNNLYKVYFTIIATIIVQISNIQSQDLTKADVKNQEVYIEALKQSVIGRHDKAVELFEELYKDDRTNDEIAYELAKAYHQLGENDLVIKYSESAIKNKPTNVWYRSFYSNYLLEQKQPESAVNQLNKLLEIDPTNEDHYQSLIAAYESLGDAQGALSTLAKMQSQFGPQPSILLDQIRIHANEKNYESALSVANRLSDIYPNREEYLIIKAQQQLMAKQEDAARLTYQQILELNPSNTEANLALMGSGTEVENENNYLRTLLPIIENSSINIDAKIKELTPYIKDLTLADNSPLEDALLEAGDRLIKAHPSEAKAYAAYGDMLLNTGNNTGAIRQYEKALSFDKSNFIVWETYMFALVEAENFELLRKTSSECLDYFPNQASVYYFNGLALGKTGKLQKGLDIIEEARIIAGGNKVILSNLACGEAAILLYNNKKQEAKGKIDEALEINPHSNYAYELLGDYHAASNEMKKAVAAWEKAISLGNTSSKLQSKINATKS